MTPENTYIRPGDGYAKCRECSRMRQRSYKERNREKVRAEARAYARANYVKNYDKMLAHNALRRARIRNAPRTELVDRLAIYERDGGRCHICGRSCSREAFHIDHLVPLSKGGDHTYANLATAHPGCNRRRHAGRLPAQLRLVG